MINIGIIGTGRIANLHAHSYAKIRGCRVIACCDVDEAAATAFADKYGIPSIYTDFHELLADSRIDGISNATTDTWHAPISIAAAKAGKHVLCEKPLATSYPEARKIVAAVSRAGVVNMINLSYRDAAAIQRAARLVQSGQLGAVKHVHARYLQGWLTGDYWGNWRTTATWLWRLSTQWGSTGTLGDIGVHIIDFASYPVGTIKQVSCVLKTLPKARRNRVGQYKLDANDTAVITAEFANGAIGVIQATRWATGHANQVQAEISCEKGAVEVNLDDSKDAVRVCRGKGVHSLAWKDIKCPKTPSNFERFIRGIRTGLNDQPDFARGAEIQAVLDACFESNKTGKAVRV